jgi:hypothetical protein
MAALWTVGGDATDPHRSYADTLGHVVMLDPEGNEFCVA